LHLNGYDAPLKYLAGYATTCEMATPDALTESLIRATVGTRARAVKQIIQKGRSGEKMQRLLRDGLCAAVPDFSLD
jgi:hypothetical protein